MNCSTQPLRRQLARDLGAVSESRVAEMLVASGCKLLARNWRGGGGELDLVVARGDKVRFVEVKARTGHLAYEPVHGAQVRRLRRAATAWMAAQPECWWTEACFVLAQVAPDGRIAWTDDPF